MTVPVAAVRVDWGNDGAFTGAYDDDGPRPRG